MMRRKVRFFGCSVLVQILIVIAGNIQPGTSSLYGSDGMSVARYSGYYGSSVHEKGMPPTLLYRFLEQSMSRGCTLSMKCIASGVPTPTIKWLTDGFDPPNSERFMIGQYVTLSGDVISHFNVTSCSSEDSAEISCTAKNGLGAVTHKSRLNIFGPPHVREFRSALNAVSGKDFHVKCPVGGYPIDEITWHREQKQLPLTSRQSTSLDGVLTIKNVQKSDRGNYTCVAKYKELFHSNRVEINVVVPPKINYFRPQTVVEEGQRIVKYCEAVGDIPIYLEWLKDGIPIRAQDITSDILIQHIGIDIALVLVITQVRREFSNTNFTCVAKNEVGDDALTTTLIVQVSPHITKFTFPEVYEGMRVSVHCAISNYPDDVNFHWYKDKILLDGGDGTRDTRILQLDKYSSLLSLENVSQINTGNYTCFAFNSYGNSSHTAELTVLVPPKWRTEPVDIETIQGGSVVSYCEADAYPTPTITWKKSLSPGRPGAYIDIPTYSSHTASSGQGNMVSFPNGTLVIAKASIQEGKHLTLVCEAENGIGSGISKLIHLRINAPVKIQPGRNTTVRVGSTGALRCVVSGDYPIHVSWFHAKEEVIPLLNPRYQVKTVNTTDGVSSELTVVNANGEDGNFPFECRVSNLCSNSNPSLCKTEQQEMWLLVLEPPETPLNLSLLLKESRFVQLAWKFLKHKNDAFTRVSIKYKSEGGPWNTIGVTQSGNDQSQIEDTNHLSGLVNDLKPATVYQFLVIAQNGIGTSESQQLVVKTNEEPPEQAPRNILVIATSPWEVKVQWDVLQWNNGEILGYNVGHRKMSDGGHYHFATIENPAYETTIRRLNPFTRYEVVVRSFNSMGQGPLSKPYLVTTLESIPTTPNGVNCYTLTSEKVQISWNKMTIEESRGILKGFKVYVQRADMDFLIKDELIVINSTDTTVVVDNLSKYTTYEVQVVGFTSKGDGEFSNSVYCQTEEDTPGPPEAIKSIRMNSISVISWSVPVNTNGQLTHYTVYIPNEMGRIFPPNITKIETKTKLQAFPIHISASTKIGEGVNSTFSVHPELNIGGGLVSFGRTIHVLSKGELSLSCETAVGTPQRTWFHQSKIIQETERKFTERQGSILYLRNINSEDGGNYSCFQPAFKWDGTSFKAERISYLVFVLSPPPPPKLREHEVTTKTITIKWTIKEVNKATVEGYLLQFKILDEWLERKIPRRYSSYVLRELSCGTTYPIYLTAYNKAGISKPSQILNITTMGHKPSLATSSELLTEVNNTWIRINLKDAFNDGGCPIQGYTVLYRKKQTDAQWRSVEENLGPGKKNAYINNLEENSSYLVKVLSENEAGSNEVTLSVNTLGSLRLTAEAEPSNNNSRSVSESIFFNFKVAGPTLLICVIILILISGVYLLFKKKIFPGNNEDANGDSFTYLKQNCQTSQPQQVYMTVKKSTPSKNIDFGQVPNSTEDAFPYATFELKDRRKSSHYSIGPSTQQSNAFYICKHEEQHHVCSSKKPRHEESEEEEEYESIGSDSDTYPHHEKHYGKHSAFAYEPDSRYSNRYEQVQKSINDIPDSRLKNKYIRASNRSILPFKGYQNSKNEITCDHRDEDIKV